MNKFTDANEELIRMFHVAVPCCANAVSAVDSMRAGIVFVDENGNVLRNISKAIAESAKRHFGFYGDWSCTFHKTWNKVATATLYELAFEQLIHYMSTYGLEVMGYDAVPMIPAEKIMTDPNKQPDFKAFTVIRMVNEETATEIVKDYLRKTVSPNKKDIGSIRKLITLVDMKPEEIASFELKSIWHIEHGTTPLKGDEFLRYMIYKVTGSTLVIKNRDTIKSLKRNLVGHNCIKSYDDSDIKKDFDNLDLKELAKYFYRFKDLWLCFKVVDDCKPIINKMRRLADVYHVPMNEMNIQHLYNVYTHASIYDFRKLLTKCSVRQLIKLLNHFVSEGKRIEDDNKFSIYNIRNGKVWINEQTDIPIVYDGETMTDNVARFTNISQIVNEIFEEIDLRLHDTKTGKIFFIPSYIKYAVPVTEKQFIGNIPYGSSFELVEGSNVIAIRWENYMGERTDIDLHMGSVDEHYGWNGGYRSGNRDVLYSGDMTDATNGAVEAFRFEANGKPYIVSANNYTCHDDVPFKLFLTQNWKVKGRVNDWDDRTMAAIDIEDAMFAPIPLKFDKERNQTIGMIKNNRFYFYGGELGDSIVPRHSMYKGAIASIGNRISEMFDLRNYLALCGATVVNEDSIESLSEKDKNNVIDLSPSTLTTRSLLDLID